MSKKSIIIVGIAVIVVIVLAVLPAFIRARNTRARNIPASNACINNLRQIDGALQEWALENHKTTNDVVTWDDIRPYVSRDGKMPTCPQGGRYTLSERLAEK